VSIVVFVSGLDAAMSRRRTRLGGRPRTTATGTAPSSRVSIASATSYGSTSASRQAVDHTSSAQHSDMSRTTAIRRDKSVNQPAQNRQVPVPKMARVLRPYHYLNCREGRSRYPHLVRERVKCGKLSCRCAQDVRHRHGPYLYLRYEEYDRRTGETRYRREYVPASELARVRQWIRRARAARVRSRGFMGILRRYVSAME
jgi:hypothetical protein